MGVKIFDAWCFCNEFESAFLRLKELDPIVDIFVICEHDRTFQGKPKPYYFEERKEEFAEFLPKIRLMHPRIPESAYANCWLVEAAQRAAMVDCLYDAAPDDIVILSDCDEIPSRRAVEYAAADLWCPVILAQTQYLYFANMRLKSDHMQAAIARRKWFSDPQQARNFMWDASNSGAISWSTPWPRIEHGGWHFHSMGGPRRIREKFLSYSHTGVASKENCDLATIESRALGGEDVTKMWKEWPGCEWVEIGSDHPIAIKEAIEKFPYLMPGEEWRAFADACPNGGLE